ncbi:unnamed protein product, partial [Rotaria sp. Silwood2]
IRASSAREQPSSDVAADIVATGSVGKNHVKVKKEIAKQFSETIATSSSLQSDTTIATDVRRTSSISNIISVTPTSFMTLD